MFHPALTTRPDLAAKAFFAVAAILVAAAAVYMAVTSGDITPIIEAGRGRP